MAPAARAIIEQRFGPLGCGEHCVSINGSQHDISDLLFRFGLNFDDSKPIDVQTLAHGHYVLRYYDGQDSRIVACEFDSTFTVLSETRAHIAEWMDEADFYSYYAGH